jgi:ABC-type branched-subunit amino acid transport system substrate-binding protein
MGSERNFMKKYLWVIVVLIVVVGIVVFGRIKNKPTAGGVPDLKIGISLPLTGSIAHLGESAQKGIELAAEEIKRDHPNLRVKYFIEDNAFTGKAAVSAYQKLKDSDNIDAIITASSPATLATEPLAKQDNILQMGIFSSTPAYSSPNDLSFRIFPRSEKEAEAILKHLNGQQFQRLAIIYINNDFGQGVLGAVSSKLAPPDSQLKIVGSESYLPDSTDFRTQLAKIKQTNPQALLTIATAQDVVSIMRQAHDMSLQTEFITTSAASDPAVLSQAAETDGLLVTDIFDPNSADQNTQNFITNFKQKFGAVPDLYAVQGYDGYKLTASALEKCRRDAGCLKSYLYGLKDYSTILGNLTFDTNGDPAYNYFIKVFKNKQFEKIKE